MHDRVSTWLRRQHAVWFVALLLAASYVATFIGLLVMRPETGTGPSIRTMGLGWRLTLTGVVAPVLETAIFQWLPITKLRLRCHWRIFLSASMFGLSHWYSPNYAVVMFLVGLVFAYGFAVRDPSTGRPFLLVAITHSIHNGVASLLV